MSQQSAQSVRVLVASTFAFTICFAVWMVFAVLGIPIKQQLNLSETQFGLLIATPVLTGSLIRVPLGIWTDRYGGRIVFFLLMLLCVPAVYFLQYATAYWQFLLLALCIGFIGGSFSVGTPYVAHWFPKNRQGFAMGVFGAGNSGSALTKFIAPILIAAAGGSWFIVPQAYAIGLLITAIVFWFFSASDPSHLNPAKTDLAAQWALLKDKRVWAYCQYYSVVFGGYVALALWMTEYYVSEYHFSLQAAALLAACFSLPGGVLRALGGYLSDRFGAFMITWWVMWVCWVCFFILSYPKTQLSVSTIRGPVDFAIYLHPVLFTFLLFIVGIAMAIGKASVFKFISDDFPEQMGIVSGIVGLAGGLGGFILPILFGMLLDITGIYSSSFMLLYGTVCVSLIAMHYGFRKRTK